MKYKLATTLLVVAALVVATFSAATTTAPPARAADPFYVDGCPPTSAATKPPCDGDSVILKWDEQLLSAIRAYPGRTGPTITARALGVLHTATYDAWAAYDPTAKGTRATSPEGPKQQVASRINEENKKKAISYAAARVLNDLFPVPSGCTIPPTNPPTPFCPIPPNPNANPPVPGYKTPNTFLVELGYPVNPGLVADPANADADPAAVGNLAAQAVLDFRHNDGSNQLGGYADTTTGYTWKNQWNELPVPNKWKWQPLCVLTPAGVTAWNADHSLPLLTPSSCPPPPAPTGSLYVQQRPLTPHWGDVITFSGLGPAQFKTMVPGPPKGAGGVGYSDAEVATAVADSDLSGTDGDRKKTIAEYWADGPGSEFPPGHTAVFAQALSRKKFINSLDSNAKLDHDAKLFFMVGNAMMDASIASWWLKYHYDFWRPTTAIRYLYNSTLIPTPPLVNSWLGPGLGYRKIEGEKWMPYQALNVVTPAFPEYPSGHSTFTGGGASLLALFNGGDTFGASVKIPAGSSKIEPGTPADPVTLSWPTFSHASNEAGMSRRYGGIHFYSGDLHGRAVGRQLAQYVYSKAQSYIKGSIGK